MRRCRPLLLVLLGAAGGAGCNGVNNPTYFTPPMGALETQQGDAGAQAAATVTLPFRSPTEKEQAKLDEQTGALGFDSPWLKREEVALSIQYSITNLGGAPGTAQILVDGANEFTSYDSAALRAAAEMAVANNDEVVVLPLIATIPVQIAPGETKSGIIREDDFAEAELDLEAIGRWMAPPAAVLINFSEVNPIGLEAVPANKVVPAMFQVIVTLAAQQPMRLEFLVRVRDSKDRLLDLARAGDAYTPQPMGYTPPTPPAGP
jgi:hypothetical protein